MKGFAGRAARSRANKGTTRLWGRFEGLAGAHKALFDDDQDYLVVVGTLHFVGKDGLLALLKKRGFKPVPLPAAR